MSRIHVDFQHLTGPVKPMHSVNNGPIVPQPHNFGNFDDYAAAGFPMARTHDASFTPAYGGPHTVDILAIFPDFSKDENDPASYDFDLTDEYMEHILAAGTKVFYRLGNRIEHESKRYGSVPPKDPAKWARICEHIIRHMNEGWAGGHHYGIEYWEIWNEPDVNPQCWDGPVEEFYPLYDIAARHLKKCFPKLKIGGPAVSSVHSAWLLEGFFQYITRDPADPAPMDFFSFHHYGHEADDFGADARAARALADRYGYKNAELILNEWNYVKNWTREGLLYSYYTIIGLKGSAYVASSVIEAQHSPLDHFMYYDSSYSVKWNGLFDSYSQKPLKPYYAMRAFGVLYGLGTEAAAESDTHGIYTAAAVSEDGREAAILASYYKDCDSIDGSGTEAETAELMLDWEGFSGENGVEAEYLLLDADHNLDVTARETFLGSAGGHALPLPLYTTVLVKLKKK
jgi:hypothetical protein